jgi:hypothetical protein
VVLLHHLLPCRWCSVLLLLALMHLVELLLRLLGPAAALLVLLHHLSLAALVLLQMLLCPLLQQLLRLALLLSPTAGCWGRPPPAPHRPLLLGHPPARCSMLGISTHDTMTGHDASGDLHHPTAMSLQDPLHLMMLDVPGTTTDSSITHATDTCSILSSGMQHCIVLHHIHPTMHQQCIIMRPAWQPAAPTCPPPVFLALRFCFFFWFLVSAEAATEPAAAPAAAPAAGGPGSAAVPAAGGLLPWPGRWMSKTRGLIGSTSITFSGLKSVWMMLSSLCTDQSDMRVDAQTDAPMAWMCAWMCQ